MVGGTAAHPMSQKRMKSMSNRRRFEMWKPAPSAHAPTAARGGPRASRKKVHSCQTQADRRPVRELAGRKSILTKTTTGMGRAAAIELAAGRAVRRVSGSWIRVNGHVRKLALQAA